MNEAAKWEILLRRDNCVNKGKTKNQRHSTGPCPYTTGHHLVWRCPIRCRGRQNKLEGRHVPEPLKGSIQTSLQVPGKPRGVGEAGAGKQGPVGGDTTLTSNGAMGPFLGFLGLFIPFRGPPSLQALPSPTFTRWIAHPSILH